MKTLRRLRTHYGWYLDIHHQGNRKICQTSVGLHHVMTLFAVPLTMDSYLSIVYFCSNVLLSSLYFSNLDVIIQPTPHPESLLAEYLSQQAYTSKIMLDWPSETFPHKNVPELSFKNFKNLLLEATGLELKLLASYCIYRFSAMSFSNTETFGTWDLIKMRRHLNNISYKWHLTQMDGAMKNMSCHVTAWSDRFIDKFLASAASSHQSFCDSEN